MTLALLVATATILLCPLLLFLRWARVLPVTRDIPSQSVIDALTFSGAFVGGVYPVLWAIASNLQTWIQSGRTVFTFSGHLPPGVDEDDLLAAIVVGLMVLVVQATSGLYRFIVDVDPRPQD